MRSFYIFLVRTLLLFALAMAGSSVLHAQTTLLDKGVERGVVKVKFKPSMATTLSKMQVKTRGNTVTTGISSLDRATKILRATGMKRLFKYDAKIEHKLKKHGLDLWYIIELDDDMDPEAATKVLQQIDEVSLAECTYQKAIKPTAFVPYQGMNKQSRATMPFNDPMLKDQWHYNFDNHLEITDGADINLFEAWKHTAGRGDVIVSIHDEGVDVNHEDLKANLWVNEAELNGITGADDDGNGYVDDIHGYNFILGTGVISAQPHGTHVAGTVAAVNNNGVGVAGVAGGTGNGDGAKLMCLQVIGGPAQIEESFIYAAKNGAVISQNSWGYNNPDVFEQSILDAIAYFVEEAGDYPNSPMNGGIVIFAAGNNNSGGDWYPGRYDKTFSVSAVGPEWKKASYSNYGSWVEVSAPGGDMDVYGRTAGILSTLPSNTYGYNNGTSMACPHVSGIAALIVANSKSQISNTVVWNKLLQGVRSIDAENPNYLGKLGKGSMDAAFAVQDDKGEAPLRITDLELTGMASDFALLKWTVPTDPDDGQPETFYLYYSDKPITQEGISTTESVAIKNSNSAGTLIEAEAPKLKKDTEYWFAVISADKWGNNSEISTITRGNTSVRSKIDIETDRPDKSIQQKINIANSPSTNSSFDLINLDTGILRWSYFARTTGSTVSNTEYAQIPYPKVNPNNTRSYLVRTPITKEIPEIRGEKVSTFAAYQPRTKTLVERSMQYIGEANAEIPISSAVKLLVNESDGFNLTQVEFYLNYTMGTGPVIVEIYKNELKRESLLMVEQYNSTRNFTGKAMIKLKEQLFFKQGEAIWIAVHVPSGNYTPQAIGPIIDPKYAPDNYYSTDGGKKWTPLMAEFGGQTSFAWATYAYSQYAPLGDFFSINEKDGMIAEKDGRKTLTLSSNGSNLINGTYESNLIFASNDSEKPELRVPLQVEVVGQIPNLVHPLVAEFGSVFLGSSKSLDVVLENVGFGAIRGLSLATDNPAFTISPAYINTLNAKSETKFKITYKPTVAGNNNGVLTIKNANRSYEISLFGVGAETSKIAVSPMDQTLVVPTIGDKVSATILVENIGKYPLKYFIPGYDDKGISQDWPSKYHSYGYKIRDNITDPSPIPYDFQDIAATGTNILPDIQSNNGYATVRFGFDFPYYNTIQKEIYVTIGGFTTFDKSVNPTNAPFPANTAHPRGYISLFGEITKAAASSRVYYKAEADRLIIQYDGVYSGLSHNNTTIYIAQMILFANGNIRFYYKHVPTTNAATSYNMIFIEDIAKKDALVIKAGISTLWSPNVGDACGFDYPGPAIIESIENGASVISPGKSQQITINLNSTTLVEDIALRYINIISNDPDNLNVQPLIKLDVQGGGLSAFELSKDKFDYDIIYKGFEYKKSLLIRNTGNKYASISSFVFDNDKFAITGDSQLKAGLSQEYIITAKTDAIGDFQDKLTINFSDGSKQYVELTSKIFPPPVVSADLNLLEETLEPTGRKSHPFVLTNVGQSPLTLNMVGATWAHLDFDASAKTMLKSYNYAAEMSNKSEPTFNWIDIIKTGTHVPELLVEDPYLVWDWLKVKLPFTFTYYGEDFEDLNITGNGIVSFDEFPIRQLGPNMGLVIPQGGKYIMPFWFDGVENPSAVEEIKGLFYQSFNTLDMTDENVANHDLFVIAWENMISSSGVGNAISIELLLYKNGDIHFQYRIMGENQGDIVSHTAVVGTQNSEDHYLAISERKRFDFGNNNALAYLVTPSNEYEIPAGQKIDGAITFDATPIYAGVFEDAIKINSNDPAQPIALKPLKLTVNGAPNVKIPDVVDFGMEAAGTSSDPIEYIIDAAIENSGNAVLTITNMQIKDMWGRTIMPQLLYKNPRTNMAEWMAISNLYDDFMPNSPKPVYTLRPGEKMIAKVVFTSTAVREFDEELTITSNAGIFKLPIKTKTYDSAILELDKEKIEHNVVEETLITDKLIVSNTGDYKLDYESSIQYFREEPETLAAKSVTVAGLTGNNVLQTTLSDKSNLINYTTKDTRNEFNRQWFYKGTNNPRYFDGMTDATFKGVYATRYNGGETGFNLSDVFTYFRGENTKEGIIEVEIKGGNSDVSKAVSLGSGSISYLNEEEDTNGAWYQITLANPIQIYPQEDFFVIFTYPAPLKSPQGVNVAISSGDIPEVEPAFNTYLTYSEGKWFDVQSALPSVYKTGGWCMMIGERKAEEIGWITIKSNPSATLQIDEKIEMNIEINPKLAAVAGANHATITFASNDRKEASKKLPVILHKNGAPIFENPPVGIYVLEGQVDVTEIKVVDSEGNDFSVEAVKTPKFVTFEFDKATGIVTLTTKPTAGDKGNYNVQLKATDEHGAIREENINVEISRSNGIPVYIGNIHDITVSPEAGAQLFDIYTLFSDPDGDRLSFEIKSDNENILSTYKIGTEQFSITGISEGETKLTITVRDPYNAVATKIINVKVTPCTDPYDIIYQKWNTVLLVDNSRNQYKTSGYQWYKNGVAIEGETKAYYATNPELDFEASYHVRIPTINNGVVYTCPMIPEKKVDGIKVYPTLVKPSATINIDTNIDHIGSDVIQAEVVHINGTTFNRFAVKDNHTSFTAPTTTGVYLLVLRSTGSVKTFKLVVK